MNGNIAIEVRDVKKRFKTYDDKAYTLKERLIKPRRNSYNSVNVLNGISFQIKRGEAVGLVGKNGCGKSTTLKLLTRILYPNEGTIEMLGKVSSLIELGAGFHPDMTGRENIYTNASIFGIKKKEVDERLSEIIRFSELEEYIDTPVRTYSSGMYMRLAFAVAINVNADILLIDEILAVGDAAFQKKCFEKLKEIKEEGTTIVIVSHSMEQMYKICDRILWLDNGVVHKEGKPQFIGEEYLAVMEGRRLERIDTEEEQKKKEIDEQIKREIEKLKEEERIKEEKHRKKIEEKIEKEKKLKELEKIKKEMDKNATLKVITKYHRAGARRSGNEQVMFTSITIKDDEGKERVQFSTGEKIVIEMEYRSSVEKLLGEFVICFTREDGTYCYGATTFLETQKMIELNKFGKVVFTIQKNTFLSGEYLLDFRVRRDKENLYDNIFSLIELAVKNKIDLESGISSLPHSWSVDGKTLPEVEYEKFEE